MRRCRVYMRLVEDEGGARGRDQSDMAEAEDMSESEASQCPRPRPVLVEDVGMGTLVLGLRPSDSVNRWSGADRVGTTRLRLVS